MLQSSPFLNNILEWKPHFIFKHSLDISVILLAYLRHIPIIHYSIHFLVYRVMFSTWWSMHIQTLFPWITYLLHQINQVWDYSRSCKALLCLWYSSQETKVKTLRMDVTSTIVNQKPKKMWQWLENMLLHILMCWWSPALCACPPVAPAYIPCWHFYMLPIRPTCVGYLESGMKHLNVLWYVSLDPLDDVGEI